MSIEMIGAVFCPLSPQDPPKRLQTLVEETKSRLVLVHDMTQEKLGTELTVFNIETALGRYFDVTEKDRGRLSTIKVTPESISYVIFTSGSTGIPKAVRILQLKRMNHHSLHCRFKCATKISQNACGHSII